MLSRFANPASVRATARMAGNGTLELRVEVVDMPDWFLGADDRACAVGVTDDRGVRLAPVDVTAVVERDVARASHQRGFLSRTEVYFLTFGAPSRGARAVRIDGQRFWAHGSSRRTFETTCAIER